MVLVVEDFCDGSAGHICSLAEVVRARDAAVLPVISRALLRQLRDSFLQKVAMLQISEALLGLAAGRVKSDWHP